MNTLKYLPPPVVALLLIAVGYGLDKAWPHLELVPATPGGVAWAAVGLTLAASAVFQFLRLKTTPLPHGTPSQLVTLGAYLWTRNPMYLGLLTALIGLAFYMGTLPFWLVPPAFFLVINRYHIPHEESRLAELFGGDYSRYRQRVNRWL